jgi:hypothetical protein
MPFTDSDPEETGLPLMGVWLHDPDDPEGTLRSFKFGANQRSDSFDAMQSGSYYVGREDPVFDYGDPSAFSVDVTIDVPHGEDYIPTLTALRVYAATRKALWMRDNRARSLFGSMSNFRTSDQPWGSSVSFTFTQAYRTVETVVI